MYHLFFLADHRDCPNREKPVGRVSEKNKNPMGVGGENPMGVGGGKLHGSGWGKTP